MIAITDDEYGVIEGRLNRAVIESDAEYAAASLHEHHYASVYCSPGDMTEYHFVILGRDAVELHDFHGIRQRREFLVALANSFGATYAWDGQYVHPSYAVQNWTKDGGNRQVTDHHTGVVVASFLNALHKELASTEGGRT